MDIKLLTTIFSYFIPGASVILDKENKDSMQYDYYYVIPGNNGPRWVIPENPLYGMSVLRQWQPYDLVSIIKWKILLFLYKFGVLIYIPKIVKVGVTVKSKIYEGYTEPLLNGNMAHVLYIGTPCVTQKAIITLVNKATLLPCFILKVPLGNLAMQCIQSEVKNINIVKNKLYNHIPLITHYDEEHGVSVQQFLYGCPVKHGWTKWHANLVGMMCDKNNVDCWENQCDKLNSRLDKLDIDGVVRNSSVKIINRISSLGTTKIGWVHGDFVSWNMKWDKQNNLSIFDWEYAENNIVSGLDAVHYFLFLNKNKIDDNQNMDLVCNKISKLLYSTGLSIFSIKENRDKIILFYIVWYVVCMTEKQITNEYLVWLKKIIVGNT